MDNWSPGLHVKNIGMTALKLLKREGIRTEGEATMAEFMGSDQRSERNKARYAD